MNYAIQLNSISDVETRNKQANDIIARYAWGSASLNGGAGLVNLIPLPGVSVFTLVATILAQGPILFTPMVQEIAEVYMRSTDKTTILIVDENVKLGAYGYITSEIVSGIVAELFRRQLIQAFLKKAIPKLAGETALNCLPVVGWLASTSINMAIGISLTWRVGLMTSAYFLNGGWVNGNIKETAKLLPDSRDTNAVLSVPEIQENIITVLLKELKKVYTKTNGLFSVKQARAYLKSRGVPELLIDPLLVLFEDYLIDLKILETSTQKRLLKGVMDRFESLFSEEKKSEENTKVSKQEQPPDQSSDYAKGYQGSAEKPSQRD